MEGRQGSTEKLAWGRKVGTGMWVQYLTTAGVLAIARVTLFVWMAHRFASHRQTETDYFLVRWLYPEMIVSVFSMAFGATHYYAAWCSLFALGSFVLATPILLVRWLRQRNLIVQIAVCGLTIPAVTALLLAIVRLFGLSG